MFIHLLFIVSKAGNKHNIVYRIQKVDSNTEISSNKNGGGEMAVTRNLDVCFVF